MRNNPATWDQESKFVLEKLTQVETAIGRLCDQINALREQQGIQAAAVNRLDARAISRDQRDIRRTATIIGFASITTAAIFQSLSVVVAKSLGG